MTQAKATREVMAIFLNPSTTQEQKAQSIHRLIDKIFKEMR